MLTTLTTRVLLVLVLLHEISYQIVIPIIEPLLQHLQNNHSISSSLLQGLNIALFTVGVTIGAPLLGMLADKKSRKSLLIICLWLLLLSTLLLSAALYFKNLWLFASGRLISGLTYGEIAIIQGIFASSARQRAVYFSYIGLMLTLGTIIGPLAAGYLADMPNAFISSLQWPFISVMLFTIIALFIVRPLRITVLTPVTEKKPVSLAFWWLISSFFLLELVWSFYFQLIPVTLKTVFQFSSHSTGSFMGLMGGAMCLALLAYGKLTQKRSLKNTVHYSLSLCMSASLLFFINTSIYWLLASMLAMALGVAFSYTAIMAAYADSVKLAYQGAAMGLTLSVMAIAWTVTGGFARYLFAYSPHLCHVLILAGFALTVVVFQKPFTSKTVSR